MKIEINKIKPDPDQPRKTFDQEDLEGLAETIKNEGLLQPLLVDSNYTIIDGERRWRACQMAGLTEIPVIVVEVKDSHKRLVLQCIEDIQHKGLPILERDAAWFKLWKELGKPNQDDLGSMLGVSQDTVSDALERAKFVPKIGRARKTASGKIVTETKGLPDDIRVKAIKKMAEENIRTDEGVYTLINRLKEAKSKEKQEEILAEPVTPYYKQADRVISAIEVLLKNLTGTLIAHIPPTQGFVLSSRIVQLEKHLKTYNSTEGEVVNVE